MSNNPSNRSSELEYERPSGITRRAFRLLLLLTFLNTILLGTSLMGPQSWQAMRGAYDGWKERRAQAAALAQREQAYLAAKAFQFPEKHVAYTEVPDEAMKLVSQGRLYRPISPGPNSFSSPPPGWQAPVAAAPLVPLVPGATAFHQHGLLFLHERKSPGGTVALVQVAVSAGYRFDKKTSQMNISDFEAVFSLSKSRGVWATAFAPDATGDPVKRRTFAMNLILPDTDSTRLASVAHPMNREMPTSQPLPIKPGHQLRLFGGSPDPADPSHFTIPYELDGKPGIIDGWLLDDSLLLRPQQGRPIASPSIPTWELLPAAGPATAPADTR